MSAVAIADALRPVPSMWGVCGKAAVSGSSVCHSRGLGEAMGAFLAIDRYAGDAELA